jgi:hypothetical protein
MAATWDTGRRVEGVRAARKEDGAAKDGRDGDTGRRVEGLKGLRARRKGPYDLEEADKWVVLARF